MLSTFNALLLASSFLGLTSLGKDFILSYLYADDLPDVRTPNIRYNSEVYKNLVALTKESGKMAQLYKIALEVLDNNAAPYRQNTSIVYKKNILVFALRPGVAFIIAYYCDRYLSN